MVNRKFLYWGVFFVAIGAVLIADQGHLLDADAVGQALVLWPVALIAVGVALVLRRTRVGIAGGIVAAALPGLLIGGMVVAAPGLTPPNCHVGNPTGYTTHDGTFGAGARVTLDLSCGDVETTVVPGSSWRLEVGDTGAPEPTIDASTDSLSIRSSGHRRPFDLGDGDVWRLALPDALPIDLSSTINAGSARFGLAGAQLGDLDLVVNAGEARVDLTDATLDTLTLRANAGSSRVQLPSSDLTATIDANAAKVSLCAPADVGVRVHQTVLLGSTQLNGLIDTGNGWVSPGYDTATHHADVTLKVNVGSVDINPEGGCK
jgi:hypothetical protein